MKTNEVEHDNISTWLEQDMLVINMIEVKTTEVKPWASTPDPGRRAQAAVKHATDGFQQLVKDFKTFKELFPDISGPGWNKIRYVAKKIISTFTSMAKIATISNKWTRTRKKIVL